MVFGFWRVIPGFARKAAMLPVTLQLVVRKAVFRGEFEVRVEELRTGITLRVRTLRDARLSTYRFYWTAHRWTGRAAQILLSPPNIQARNSERQRA
jgi:hypothetical protein